jgi:hypothetical protein
MISTDSFSGTSIPSDPTRIPQYVKDRTIQSRSELRVQLLVVLVTIALINVICPALYVLGRTVFTHIYFELSIFSGVGIVFYVVLNRKWIASRLMLVVVHYLDLLRIGMKEPESLNPSRALDYFE